MRIDEFDLDDDQAPTILAQVIHGAGVTVDADIRPQSRRLEVIALRLMLLGLDDQRQLELELRVYDALYAWAQHQVGEG